MAEESITVPIVGMTCANCAVNVERQIKKLDGVHEANVNFAAEQAKVRFDPKSTDVHSVVQNITGSGFSVPTTTTRSLLTSSGDSRNTGWI